jgi:hypothetical protein
MPNEETKQAGVATNEAVALADRYEWTPVARTLARVKRAGAEEPGSMQHFTAALHLVDVITKLHALAVIGVLEGLEACPSALSFELARANSTGPWVGALRDAAARVQPAMIDEAGAADWFAALRTWLTLKRRRPDEDSLAEVLEPLAKLAELLIQRPKDLRVVPKTPADLMQTMVEVRNKTTGHHAYGPEFWKENIATVSRAAEWLRDTSPLWDLTLALPMRRAGKSVARLLAGTEPEETVDLADLERWGATPVCLMDRVPVLSLGELVWVDPATNLTYFANGGWRDSDSSVEFLCHSLEAARPGQGSARIELPSFAIRPASLAASETEGEPSLVLEVGVVPHNLPPSLTGYVRRGSLEETMRGYMLDSKRRHLINVRGPGGFGKTSLLLMLCHELASSPENSPYDAIVWMSARDIDLTLHGAAPVRRAEESLADVWQRYARLFGEDENGAARDFFELSMKEEAILLILDNFETFNEQETAYGYLDDLVQPPAKIVITSRHVFKGDYALEV